MIGISVMKELTTLNSKFTESEVKKENKFSRSPNFDSHVYISTVVGVSNGWKSHFG